MKITKHLLLTLCTGVTACAAPPAGPDAGFTPISPQKAKEMMDAGQELLILDVREQDEYDSGHIPGAKLLPLSTIRPASAAQIIRRCAADLEGMASSVPVRGTPGVIVAVLVYCHSGRRSRKACLLLSKLGYTHICDLGGILDWPYEKE